LTYGLSIYGPFTNTLSALEDVTGRLGAVFPSATEDQIFTVWTTMCSYYYFNTVEVVWSNGDLLIHVYGMPIDVFEDADCLFHAKISPSGTYC